MFYLASIERWRIARRLKWNSGQRRYIGEAPLLVACGRHRQCADAIDGVRAQAIQPRVRGRRKSRGEFRLPGQQTRQIAVCDRRAHARAVTPALYAALTQS